jgi:preprotein translocase subunit SecA
MGVDVKCWEKGNFGMDRITGKNWENSYEPLKKSLTKKIIAKIDENKTDFMIINYPNADMVGHSGNYCAAVVTVEALDFCLGKIFDNIKEKLILLAIIFNINLPEAKKWKSQFRNDTARLIKARRLALLARGIQENHMNLADDIEDDDDDYGDMPNDIADFDMPTKIGRNELCSCGSGKKYKKCCEKTTIKK